MKNIATLLVLAVLCGAATASVREVPLWWNNSTRAKLVAGTTACTTSVVDAINWSLSPDVAFSFKLYSNNNSAESARVNVLFKWSGNKADWDTRIDTVMTTVCSRVGDTTKLLARYWCEEFYPRVSAFGYFIIQGIAGNGDSTYAYNPALVADVKQ